jgi:hypothetical protein
MGFGLVVTVKRIVMSYLLPMRPQSYLLPMRPGAIKLSLLSTPHGWLVAGLRFPLWRFQLCIYKTQKPVLRKLVFWSRQISFNTFRPCPNDFFQSWQFKIQGRLITPFLFGGIPLCCHEQSLIRRAFSSRTRRAISKRRYTHATIDIWAIL